MGYASHTLMSDTPCWHIILSTQMTSTTCPLLGFICIALLEPFFIAYSYHHLIQGSPFGDWILSSSIFYSACLCLVHNYCDFGVKEGQWYIYMLVLVINFNYIIMTAAAKDGIKQNNGDGVCQPRKPDLSHTHTQITNINIKCMHGRSMESLWHSLNEITVSTCSHLLKEP